MAACTAPQKDTLNIWRKKQIPPQLYDEKKIFHLRGAVDYDQLELKYRILMKLMYSRASKLPESWVKSVSRSWTLLRRLKPSTALMLTS